MGRTLVEYGRKIPWQVNPEAMVQDDLFKPKQAD
jgi:hypothetical protein